MFQCPNLLGSKPSEGSVQRIASGFAEFSTSLCTVFLSLSACSLGDFEGHHSYRGLRSEPSKNQLGSRFRVRRFAVQSGWPAELVSRSTVNLEL